MMELLILKDWLRFERHKNMSSSNYQKEHYYSVVFDKVVEIENRYLCMSLREAGYGEP